MQQSTRLQRRCYWLLESEDDIVLVHYLNIDKAKGKTEDTWTATDSDMSRRAGFTVTSGGIHNIQVSCCKHWLALCRSAGLAHRSLCECLAVCYYVLSSKILCRETVGDGKGVCF